MVEVSVNLCPLQVIARLPMPHVGDELHHSGWNACSRYVWCMVQLIKCLEMYSWSIYVFHFGRSLGKTNFCELSTRIHLAVPYHPHWVASPIDSFNSGPETQPLLAVFPDPIILAVPQDCHMVGG